ncbi:MAG TPA: extracellular matrix/biofilm biosynthesis regulator RemA family protein [Nostocaceae cyanobacterium]|nr:extracellular matrix/biofilm biosynthesis regulator RemA family protein [Nostocaceae cyanobacterium]
MTFVDIGYGNSVQANRVIAIVSPDSVPIKRRVQAAKERQTVIDATHGRITRAVIFTDTDEVILSSLQPATIANRLNKIEKIEA